MLAAPTSTDQLNTLILCGGAGTRMGGRDKPLMYWRARPMIEHVQNTLPAEARCLISANRNQQQYARYGTVVSDASTGLSITGPLVGVLAGLQHADRDWLLITPGDTPYLTSGWYQPLLDAAQTQDAYAYVVHDGQQQQHLHQLVHVDVCARLHAFLSRGQYKVYEWLADIGAKPVSVNHPDWFRNMNQPTDLDDAE